MKNVLSKGYQMKKFIIPIFLGLSCLVSNVDAFIPEHEAKAQTYNNLVSHLSWCDITPQDGNFIGYDLSSSHLDGFRLDTKSNFSKANLSDASLIGTNFTSSSLIGTLLIRANLCGAVLSNANARGANLYGANLTAAVLQNICFDGAILTNANLSRADLTNVDLALAADLTGTNLYAVMGLSDEQLAQALSRGAIMEPGV